MPRATLFGLPRSRVLDAAAAVRRDPTDPVSDRGRETTAREAAARRLASPEGVHHDSSVRDTSGHDTLGREDEAALLDTFARAAWSSIVEPGDSAAHELLDVLGAPAALNALVRDEPARYWSAVMLEHHAGDLDPEVTLERAERALARWRPRLAAGRVLDVLDRAGRTDTVIVGPHDHEWPLALNDLGSHAPLCLWVRGNLDTLEASANSVSLVGARASSRYGESVTVEIATGLVERGYTIVSGAAYGIDAVAHRAALASHGQTVAVLAGGADRPYPAGHEALLSRIVRDGVVISEVPNGTSPTRWRFLQRNRLIAALSRGTVVMEAGWRSGSLNTAGHAATLGRPLGAVPGPVTNASSAGCHRLLREYGAQLIIDAETVVELIEPLTATLASPTDLTTPDSPGDSHSASALTNTPIKSARTDTPSADSSSANTAEADHEEGADSATVATSAAEESRDSQSGAAVASTPSPASSKFYADDAGYLEPDPGEAPRPSSRNTAPLRLLESDTLVPEYPEVPIVIDTSTQYPGTLSAPGRSLDGPSTWDLGTPSAPTGSRPEDPLPPADTPGAGSLTPKPPPAGLAESATSPPVLTPPPATPRAVVSPPPATLRAVVTPPIATSRTAVPPTGTTPSVASPSAGVPPALIPHVSDSSLVGSAGEPAAGSSRRGGTNEYSVSQGVDASEISRVRDCLSRYRPRSPQEIAVDAGLSFATVRAALGFLALHEEVFDSGEGWLLKAPPNSRPTHGRGAYR
ncbi:DNA-processing protein DprA [Mycetocola saprophilus]|uniref:DNA-processing protein DprA n=1 Tax=Mycetocola saprophilus TaxID=76636 RepID=UPI000AC94B4D|nr:DNA-processing protein DprA [Mycetocola saprophilus]